MVVAGDAANRALSRIPPPMPTPPLLIQQRRLSPTSKLIIVMQTSGIIYATWSSRPPKPIFCQDFSYYTGTYLPLRLCILL